MKMKHCFGKYFALSVALCTVSCSGYNKLLKSDDHEQKYKMALEYYEKGKYSKTASLLESLNQVFAGTNRSDTLAYYYGASLYKQGDFVTSGEIFDGFRHHYGRSPFLEDVEYMYAKGLYFSAPSYKRDQTNTHKAIMAIGEYLNRYPTSAKKESLMENVTELQQRLYDKSMENAKLYYDIGYYNSAIVALRNAIELYPETNHRELLSYLIVRSHYLYAKNSIPEKQRQRYMDLQDSYYSFVAEYAESSYRKEVDKMQEEAKKFLARYSEKEQAKEAAAEAKKAKTDKPAVDVRDEHIPELKLKPLETPEGMLKPKKIKQNNEFNLQNSTIQNGNQEK